MPPLTVALGDLVTGEAPVISDLRLEGRLITGPGILLPFDCDFSGSSWTASFETVFWPIDPARRRVVGAVFAERCAFIDCVFNGVGLAGTEQERPALEALWL